MKKILLILILATNTIFAQSEPQPAVGLTAQELKNEFPNFKFNTVTPDGGDITVVSVTTSEGDICYYFKKGASRNYYCSLKPRNNEVMNMNIKYFNENFVPVSTSKWIIYTDNGSTGTITLKFSEGFGYAFIYE
jgi:hypothetical protein